ncbi:hypothetical protein E2C01_078583 [Portunus trituberculatus]|uniref:Uncharacterized protein n=1 Tax=Portunus trituberculatus TaxID=210409 RepID=A0A5B7IN37_PORTR|nr:hypothetical protein [Portunus trituberculatus]
MSALINPLRGVGGARGPPPLNTHITTTTTRRGHKRLQSVSVSLSCLTHYDYAHAARGRGATQLFEGHVHASPPRLAHPPQYNENKSYLFFCDLPSSPRHGENMFVPRHTLTPNGPCGMCVGVGAGGQGALQHPPIDPVKPNLLGRTWPNPQQEKQLCDATN